MGTNTTPLRPAREYMDQALESERGIRIECPSPAKAKSLRFSMYKIRRNDRLQNARVYPPDHPMHERSPYDPLYFRVEDSMLYITKEMDFEVRVEEL